MGENKLEKKEAKARAKIAKGEAKVRAAELRGSTGLPEGVGIAMKETGDGTQLTIHGLSETQLNRIIPQINKEILISMTEDKNSLKAGFMRFVREGVFQTIIKIIAGLVVGYLLIQFGME